jgi:hypothetical protein
LKPLLVRITAAFKFEVVLRTHSSNSFVPASLDLSLYTLVALSNA